MDGTRGGRSKRNQKGESNDGKAALLEKIVKMRADREKRKECRAEETEVDAFWPSAAENDARLFDESEESAPEAETTKDLHGKLPGKPKLVRKRSSGSGKLGDQDTSETAPMAKELAAAGLVKLPSDSESVISIPDDDDGVDDEDGIDDVLCNKLGSMSLNKKHEDEKPRTKIIDCIQLSSSSSSSSGSFGSAKSTLGSGSAGVRQPEYIDCDDESHAVFSASAVPAPKRESFEESESMVLEEGNMKFILPAKVSTKLYAHQREGVRWLWDLHVKRMGGILGDDMGLGKTMQIAAFLSGLFSSRQIKRALVVAPTTLIPHWNKELTVVGLGRQVKDYSGETYVRKRETNLAHVFQVGGILLTSYDIVRNNAKALSGDVYDFDDVAWDYMILDEGHIIKNPSTQRAKSCKEIPCAHRIILSGTPIQNNLREMWALFDFCCPDLLGDRKEFKAKYEDLVYQGNDKRATDRQKRIGSAAAQELRDRIAPYFLRRLKSDVFPETGESSTPQLPRKNDIIVWLRLSQLQRQMYTAFLQSKTVHESLDGSALAALTILKKICDHPMLLTKRATDDVVEGMEYGMSDADAAAAEKMRASLFGPEQEGIEAQNEHSCKIVFLLSLLDYLVREGHRTLVFAQTLKMLDVIQEEISRRKYSFCRIDGKFKGADRQRTVEEFQRNSKISIFLLTSQVGGLGLTLTGADRVVIIDPAWNPSRDNQSVDRAYRIGQVKDVIVYRLMTCGTLEEKIYRKQVFKGGLMKVATEHKEQFRYFSQQELRELLTVPETGFDISPTQQQLYEEHAHQFQEDENLSKHIKFLEDQGIAGVSHHDLLFSKAAPALPPEPEDEAANVRMLGAIQAKNRSKTVENMSGAHAAAFQPGSDYWKGNERVNLAELDKSVMNTMAVEQQINRLSTMLSNRALVSKLPDGGENIKKKIKDLEATLEAKKKVSEDVDAFSSAFDKLNV